MNASDDGSASRLPTEKLMQDTKMEKQPEKEMEKEARPVLVDYNQIAPLPFCGGYFDKRNGNKYLNAAQQTDKKPKPPKNLEMYSRQTQLCLMRNQNWNTLRETFTQMDRRDLVLDWSRDYARVPGRYVDSIEWEGIRTMACVVIQKYVRRWIARRKAVQRRKFIEARIQFLEEQEKLQKLQSDEALRGEIERRIQPRSTADFGILYQELEAWRLQELEKINECPFDYNERVTALMDLLKKELKLLTAIDTLRAIAAKANKEERIKKTMLKMCAPKIWELTNGKIVHVRTPATARASDLMHLYSALAKDFVSVDERMGVLGYVKWTVQEYNCPLTKDILMLIEREADLMYRNRPPKSLVGLRQRILALFLRFVETPEFNPEAAGYQYVHTDFDFEPKQSMVRRNHPLEVAK